MAIASRCTVPDFCKCLLISVEVEMLRLFLKFRLLEFPYKKSWVLALRFALFSWVSKLFFFPRFRKIQRTQDSLVLLRNRLSEYLHLTKTANRK